MKYERQTGTALPEPDSVRVATLLNKASGALQTHLRLNARTLTTYEQIRATVIEYHQSRHILTGASSSSNQGPAPMDIGGLKGPLSAQVPRKGRESSAYVLDGVEQYLNTLGHKRVICSWTPKTLSETWPGPCRK